MTVVPLSVQTIEILKNFSTINTSIVVKAGNELKTISNAENIFAQATVEETFPRDFAIYDLSQFIVGLSLFESPVLHFDNDNYVTIRDSNKGRRVKYYFSNPEITMKASPDREIKFPGGNINFDVTFDNIALFLRHPLYTVSLILLLLVSRILSPSKSATRKMTHQTRMIRSSQDHPTMSMLWTLKWRTSDSTQV